MAVAASVLPVGEREFSSLHDSFNAGSERLHGRRKACFPAGISTEDELEG